MNYALNHCKAHYNADKIVYTGPCIVTGYDYSVEVKASAVRAWRNGAYIQDCMSDVSIDDREFLMSGYSPEGWKERFPEDEDDIFYEPNED